MDASSPRPASRSCCSTTSSSRSRPDFDAIVAVVKTFEGPEAVALGRVLAAGCGDPAVILWASKMRSEPVYLRYVDGAVVEVHLLPPLSTYYVGAFGAISEHNLVEFLYGRCQAILPPLDIPGNGEPASWDDVRTDRPRR